DCNGEEAGTEMICAPFLSSFKKKSEPLPDGSVQGRAFFRSVLQKELAVAGGFAWFCRSCGNFLAEFERVLLPRNKNGSERLRAVAFAPGGVTGADRSGFNRIEFRRNGGNGFFALSNAQL